MSSALTALVVIVNVPPSPVASTAACCGTCAALGFPLVRPICVPAGTADVSSNVAFTVAPGPPTSDVFSSVRLFTAGAPAIVRSADFSKLLSVALMRAVFVVPPGMFAAVIVNARPRPRGDDELRRGDGCGRLAASRIDTAEHDRLAAAAGEVREHDRRRGPSCRRRASRARRQTP